MKPNWYTIRAAASDAAEVSIYTDIAFGVAAEQFVREVKAITAATINVHINSPGGSVFDGLAIFNALRAHPATVVTHIDGLAASIASVIALAGDEVRIASNAFVMIHNPAMVTYDDAGGHEKNGALLRKFSATIAQIYAAKTGKPVDEMQAAMDAETWYTADEAKAAGLIDVVVGADPAMARMAASFDLQKFRHAPAALRTPTGHAGFVPAPMGIITEAGARETAVREWTAGPALRAEFSSQANYLAYRVAELLGNHRQHGPRHRAD